MPKQNGTAPMPAENRGPLRTLESFALLLKVLMLVVVWLAPATSYAQSTEGGTSSEIQSEAAPSHAHGDETVPTLPKDLTPAAIRDLLAKLPDDQVRALLLQQLDKAARSGPGITESMASGRLMQMETMGATLRDKIEAVLAQAPRVPSVAALVSQQLRGAGGVPLTVLYLALVLAAGFIARALWRRVIGKRQDRIAARNVDAGAYASLAVIFDAAIWLILELSGVAIFYAVAMASLFILLPDGGPARLFCSTYVTAMTAMLAVLAFTEFCLPRKWPAYRLLPLSDAATGRIHIYIAVLAVIWNFGFFTCELLAIYHLEPQMLQFLVLAVSSVFLVVLIAAIWSIRKPVAQLIRGDRGLTGGLGYLRGLLADSWHLLASGYMLLVWALSSGRLLLVGWGPMSGTNKTGLMSLLLFVAAPVLDIMIERFVTAQLGADNPIAAAIKRTLRLVIFVGAAAIFLHLWGIDAERLEAVGIAGWVVAAAIDVGLIALVGYAIWQLIRALINRRLEAEGPEIPPEEMGHEGEGGAGATRAATLLPLVRSFALAAIAVMVVLTALSSLGVNIGPLIAGAGVVGIAIGFGAQTLVRDIFSGIFFLIDDAFRKGEYIDIGDAKGTVEKISIRSFQLRHHNGPLNTIPFGEIKKLTNYSRDWVIMKLPLRLTYDTDIERVRKLIKKLGQELMEDPELGPKFLEPLKSQGVIEMDDSAMILRVKFMTKPGDQFGVRNKVYAHIRELFAKENIKFASREVRVRVAADEDKSADAKKHAALGAVRPILDEEGEAPLAANDER